MEWGEVTNNTSVSGRLLTGWQGVGWGGSINLKHLQCCLKMFIDSKIGGKVGWGVLILSTYSEVSRCSFTVFIFT